MDFQKANWCGSSGNVEALLVVNFLQSWCWYWWVAGILELIVFQTASIREQLVFSQWSISWQLWICGRTRQLACDSLWQRACVQTSATHSLTDPQEQMQEDGSTSKKNWSQTNSTPKRHIIIIYSWGVRRRSFKKMLSKGEFLNSLITLKSLRYPWGRPQWIDASGEPPNLRFRTWGFTFHSWLTHTVNGQHSILTVLMYLWVRHTMTLEVSGSFFLNKCKEMQICRDILMTFMTFMTFMTHGNIIYDIHEPLQLENIAHVGS